MGKKSKPNKKTVSEKDKSFSRPYVAVDATFSVQAINIVPHDVTLK